MTKDQRRVKQREWNHTHVTWYARNKQRAKKNGRRWAKQHRAEITKQQRPRGVLYRKQLRDLLNDIKAHTPCTDCQYAYPHWVMEFDHCVGEKNFNLGAVPTSMPRILAEMMLCDLVCANCHAERTYYRRAKA